MAILQARLHSLAESLIGRRQCACCANDGMGFSHAAVIFSHNCPFRNVKLWRKSL